MLSRSDTAVFLHFGYLPRYTSGCLDSLCDWSKQDERRAARACRDIGALINDGVAILKMALGGTIAETDAAKTHVVSLSGGLDSRAILGGLLESVDAKKIQAVTFGTPGTWDYEIGQIVARAAGVQCEAIDLTCAGWKWDSTELVKTAASMDQPVWIFDAHVNRSIPDRLGRESVYSSGFMGDPLAGSHLCKQDSISWSQAMSCFVARGRYCRSTKLTPPGFSALDSLPQVPLAAPSILCYDEQLDFAVRQDCYIKAIVVPRGYDYYTPFLHPDWVSFILSVPRRYRRGQYLYREILKGAYPRLFSLPVKNDSGLPLTMPHWRRNLRRQRLRLRGAAKRLVPWVDWGVSPNTNYIDFNRGLRERTDLGAVVYENIHDLKKRRIVDWIDIDAIWDRHHKRRANHADALTLLASLEINLKAQEIQPK